MKKGQVVWVKLSGDGHVQRGLRPCIVVQNDTGNRFSDTTIIVPLTTKRTKTQATHVQIEKKYLGKKMKDSIALTEQVKVIDKKDIFSFGTILPKEKIDELNRALRKSLGLVQFFPEKIFSEKISRGKIVWAKLSGDGHVQRGLRPCVVVQNDLGNMRANTTIVIPLTTKVFKKNMRTHTHINEKYLGSRMKSSVALAEQIRIINKDDIISIGKKLPKEVMEQIDRSVMVSLELKKG